MSSSMQAKTKKLLFGTQNVWSLGAGVVLAVMIMLMASFMAGALNKVLPSDKNILSSVFMTIILGLIVGNLFSPGQIFEPGMKFGIKKLLRLGIILMGIRLSITELFSIALTSIGLIVVCILAALVITGLVAKRIGISSKLGTLVAAETSICGVSAIVATSPVIKAEEEETAYAVATITIFGMLATMCYPYLVEMAFHLDTAQAGFFLGTSVHDTAQATASAVIYDQLWEQQASGGLSAANIAITTKLVRNTFMIAVIPFLGFWYAKKNAQHTSAGKPKLSSVIPFFVIGFVIMGVVRSLGDYGFGAEDASWKEVVSIIKESAKYLVAIAVACIGLNTNIRKLLKLGFRPFLCGLIAAVSVGGVSLLLVKLFGSYLQI